MPTQKPDTPVVTRFAVSPTGFMHIGGVRTALYSYLWARKNNGTFILRIEDTDKSREVPGAVEQIITSLRWLGIEWDYGPDKPHPEWGSNIQSERLDVYKTYGEQLIEQGLAYPDPYTDEEVATFREQAAAEKRPFLFRKHRPEQFDTWDGTRPLRLKVPEVKRYHWHDEVRGDLTGGEDALDDIVIIKSDGFPTYNFCHIVDDYIMGVSHVMRSDEFIASMPRFLSIHDALAIPCPAFVSLPPIMGPSGKKKLSKRDGAKDVLGYRDDGFLPETMQNFLALIGWHPSGNDEIFSPEELISQFSIEHIQKSGGAFNEDKLKWMNKEHILKRSIEEQVAYVVAALPHRDSNTLSKLTSSILERTHSHSEIVAADQAGEYNWAFSSPSVPKPLLQWKQDTSPEEAIPRLEKVQQLLQEAEFSSPDNIKAALWEYADTEGRGQVLWPLRVALTGQERSPDPFTCAFVIGREETLARIHAAINTLSE